ncbi:uncharacterized protein LACBIDRAFT_310745 [Laccaria bicolor S238N-H82]|uniref:Predicted protein n=1 Tax=Laccaria bicolor (strain S238N-H82 / ATCC MYA-4686) TaxID=486041 RepID=B0DV05_LACBS|nr:uncharacterized protein LACBIDRAFT_310745 [Laccaria bicolor S238N-H82]EDR01706.1 predicted protein [Laccaria bicolor S238N-H82]|eukprot:XP_001887782.1 predicted protein [Laccaria bicolor S238N-H82]
MEDFIRRWPMTPLQKGILTAVLELGALFGALSAGLLADRYSCRHSIIAACRAFSCSLPNNHTPHPYSGCPPAHSLRLTISYGLRPRLLLSPSLSRFRTSSSHCAHSCALEPMSFSRSSSSSSCGCD